MAFAYRLTLRSGSWRKRVISQRTGISRVGRRLRIWRISVKTGWKTWDIAIIRCTEKEGWHARDRHHCALRAEHRWMPVPVYHLRSPSLLRVDSEVKRWIGSVGEQRGVITWRGARWISSVMARSIWSGWRAFCWISRMARSEILTNWFLRSAGRPTGFTSRCGPRITAGRFSSTVGKKKSPIVIK